MSNTCAKRHQIATHKNTSTQSNCLSHFQVSLWRKFRSNSQKIVPTAKNSEIVEDDDRWNISSFYQINSPNKIWWKRIIEKYTMTLLNVSIAIHFLFFSNISLLSILFSFIKRTNNNKILELIVVKSMKTSKKIVLYCEEISCNFRLVEKLVRHIRYESTEINSKLWLNFHNFEC